MPTVTIPGHGDVEFPDSMKDEDVLAAVRKLSPPTAAQPQPSKTESLLRGAAQGATFGFGDEAQGVVQALGQRILPESMGGGDSGKSFSQLYKENRDTMRRENAAAKTANPWSYGAGQAVGGAPLAVATGGAGPASAARLIGTGAAAGGLSGLGESTAEGVGRQALDATKGAALGAALTGGMVGLGKAVPAAAGALRQGAIGTARRVLVNKTGSLSAAKALPAEAVQEVLDSGVIKPFGTSAGAAERLEGLRETVGDQYGQIVAALEKAGITGPDAQALAKKYAAEATTAGAQSMNPTVANVYQTAAEQVGGKATGPLGLSQGEQLKRSLQGMAKSAYKQQMPSEVGQAHEATASMMRQAIEDEVAKQAPNAAPDVQQIASQFEPVKDRLSKLIAAGNVAREGAAREANRNLFSPLTWGVGLAEMAHGGNPIRAAAAGAGAHLLRSRGPSTAASALNAGANALDWLSGPALSPAQTRVQALIEALRTRALPLAAEEAGGRSTR